MPGLARRHGVWLVAAAVWLLFSALRGSGALRPLEWRFTDWRAGWQMREVDSRIVIVGIDEAGFRGAEAQAWPRRRHGELLEQLARSSPRSVFLDFDFGSLTNPVDDGRLELALARPRDFPVLLPLYVRQLGTMRDVVETSRPRTRFARRTEPVVVQAVPDRDGRTRTWRTSWLIEGVRTPTIIDPQRRLPDQHEVIIDYSISPSSFTRVDYGDVLDGRVPRDVFAGKEVFVGAAAPSGVDLVAVPLHGALPDVVVQALAAETVAQGAPKALPAWASTLWLGGWLALGAFFLDPRRRLRWFQRAAAMLLSWGAMVGAALYAFHAGRLVLDVAAPALGLLTLLAVAGPWLARPRAWRALAHAFGQRRHDALLKSIVQSSADCIICVDEHGLIRMVNPAATRLFGTSAHGLIGQRVSSYLTVLAGDGPGARLDALHGVIRECDARSARGEVFPVEISVSRVRHGGGDHPGSDGSDAGHERLYTAIVRDIRERRAQERRLRHQATHDPLTGLPNRAALLTHLEQALTGNSASSLALLLLDLCRFKEVNDSLGHGIGDRVLCEVAQRFERALAGRGLIARIGGDEFTVVLDAFASADHVAQVAQQLAASLGQPIEVAGIAIEVGVSIGIARSPDDATDAQSLLRQADAAMYAAKRRGTAYQIYDPSHDEHAARRMALDGELRAAIAHQRLELHYQPLVNLRSGLVEHCEALLRWPHPTLGVISPAEVIGIAESTDLIRPLAEWTLSTTLAQLRHWRDRGLHLRASVNLPARLLQDRAFPARLRELLRASGVTTGLDLEITERALMQDPARALRVIQEVEGLGVRIAIDDFGTGYSSLGYLRDLPVHALKLDRSFVLGMRHQADDRIIVESTARMAQGLRLELIAEGVENDWDAQFLRACGYQQAQGFLYSGALPPDRFLAWVSEHNATAVLSGEGGDPIGAHPAHEPRDDDFDAGGAHSAGHWRFTRLR